MRPRPVHLNTWEAVYFNHDDATLRALAEHAAALGVERFVLDDGWFPGRPNDHSGLGDWWPDPLKYPQGLGPLIAHVLGLGMAFGLWVEPEMVNPNSDLFRAHPDWALQVAGQSLQLGRLQLVLDLSRPEVGDYLFDKLDALLRENRISYLKWDMNRDLAQAADARGQLAYAKQIPALYALLQRLRAQHPAVEIESCASGGGRMDLGILQHTQRFWTSDNNDAVSRIAIQSGAARLFPLEVLGAHVGPAPAHTTGRSQSLDLRCAVALFGHMGVEADVRKFTEAEAQTLATWIGIYKSWRAVLHGSRFTQGRTANGVWCLAQHEGRALLGVFTQTAPTSMHHAPLLVPCLQGLHDTTLCQLRLLGQAGQERARGDAASPWLDALRGAGVSCSAAELRHVGLPLPNMNPESALVFSLEWQSS
jgi:alpha-galactosidase